MDSRSRQGGVRARVLAMVMAIAASGAALVLPAAAEASTYIWKVGANGTWTDPANWQLVPGTGALGTGFPNLAGDVASFTRAYMTIQTVVIPDTAIITVGQINFAADVEVKVAAGGVNARLILDSGPGAEVRVTAASDATFLLSIEIHGPLVVTSLTTSRRVSFEAITEDGVARAVTKTGVGGALFEKANGYHGPTTVDRGELYLVGPGPVVPGDLVIGDANGPPGSAVVYMHQPSTGNAIAPSGRIVVNASGRLEHVSTQAPMGRIGTLIVNGGKVENFHLLAIQNLAMTGGELLDRQDGGFVLEGPVTATAGVAGAAIMSSVRRSGTAGHGSLNLLDTTRTFTILDGPGDTDLVISNLSVIGTGNAGLIKDGPGTLEFNGTRTNTYPGAMLVRQGRLELISIAGGGGVGLTIPGPVHIGGGPNPAVLSVRESHNIGQSATVSVSANGLLSTVAVQDIGTLIVNAGGRVFVGEGSGGGILTMASLVMTSGQITLSDSGAVLRADQVVATSSAIQPAVIDGLGILQVNEIGRIFDVADGPHPIDLRVDTRVGVQTIAGIVKRGAGVVQFTGDGEAEGGTTVVEGTFLVTGTHLQPGAVTLSGGTLGGTGIVGPVTASAGTIAPGLSPGRLVSGPVAFAAASSFAVELNGPAPGTGYDQLAVIGSVSLGNATLALIIGAALAPDTTFTIIENDGADPVTGTFAGLAEGTTVPSGARLFTISYRGGDGNDVVLTDVSPLTYFLAEGATGEFFDEDVLIANPTDTEAPVTLTFLQEGGSTVVEHRTIAAQSRMTVHVDQIAGLESTAASVQVASDHRVPLVVERSMFWDASYYGGHTANAVAQPELRWTFAEGFQGFFDTYILIANANAQATTATLTFLREGNTPVVKTVPVGPFARKTVYAGDYPDVAGAFGIVVDATLPVIAERAMYFASIPGRFWAGGHVNTGIVAPSTSWFHAEGATGSYFNTFILLSNPQDTAAHVELRFLLDTGAVITRQKTIEARQRLTINPAGEGDVRLENAAVSTVVQSDVPIVSERSMYWPGDAAPFGEGHNSTGVVNTAIRWGLAEGRIGGPRQFDTYILLANPSTKEANVTITYLRESGTPIVQTYAVPATSRFNVDVKSVVPELQNTSFGARIEVTNNVPIAVERSLYWNANGVFWAGGTNALATPLP